MWYTVKDLAKKMNVTTKTIRRRIKKGEWETKKVAVKAKSGATRLLIHFADAGKMAAPESDQVAPESGHFAPESGHLESGHSATESGHLESGHLESGHIAQTNEEKEDTAENKADAASCAAQPVRNSCPPESGHLAEANENKEDKAEPVWLSTANAAKLLGRTEQYLRKCPEKFGGVKYNSVWMFPLHALPARAQKLYWEAQPAHRLQAVARVTPEREQIALYKAELVREVFSRKPLAVREEFLANYNKGVLLPDIRKQLGEISMATLYRWRKKIKQSGTYLGLIEHRGVSRKRHLPEHEKQMLLKLLLHPNRPKVYTMIRYLRSELERQGREPSSRSAMYRFIKEWRETNYDIWVRERHGDKALNDNVLPYLIRDDGVLEVGDVLVADGHDLNFQVLNPLTGKPSRAKVVVFLDWASRMPAGWQFAFSENIEVIHAALRRSIISLGKMPKYVVLDNGRAFKASVFTSRELLESDFSNACFGFSGLYGRLGIGVHFAQPYHGQSKIIERFFGTFNEQFQRLVSSYVGNSISDKPARLMRNEKYHRKQFEKYGYIPTLEEAAAAIEKWFEWYGNQEHSGIKGKPLEVWTSGKGNGVNIEKLDFLMMKIAKNKPIRNGMLELNGVKYIADELYGLNMKVRVHYDVHDWDRILVYDPKTGEQICVAHPVQTVHPLYKLSSDKGVKEQIEKQLRHKAELKKATKAAAKLYTSETNAFEEMMNAFDKAIEGSEKLQLEESETKLLPEAEVEPTPNPSQEVEEEAATVLEVDEEAATRLPQSTPAKRPLFFSELEKYKWLVQQEDNELREDDKVFMEKFEQSSIYQLLYG